ncbi:MAG: 6-hydroxymethylpterin diphosphokinase MptE-like protein [Candidatus Thorarchaeota archaeon SMTZ1-83]
MDWVDWEPTYNDIVNRLNLDCHADRQATEVLTHLLENKDPHPALRQIEKLIEGRSVIVCGAGPSLDFHLREVIPKATLEESTCVASDGAASALLELGLRCDILVTDLDGDLQSIREVVRRGAIPVVHAHGDNIDLVREIVPTFETVVGSTQVEPTERAFLWGGFTDGDRACHLVTKYRPSKVTLAGMDFGSIVGRWSKPGYHDSFPADSIKREKLAIAGELIDRLMSQSDVEFTLL